MNIQATPRNEAGRLALEIYRDALDAVRADRLIEASVRRGGDVLQMGELTFNLRDYERIIVVGAGKASSLMAAAIDPILGDALNEGVVVTKDATGEPVSRIRLLEAGHPIPDERSVAAGQAIHDLAQKAAERDLMICLLSGGASALMELPAPGITLADLQQTTQLLLRAGATINELNTVRACLSQLKAGGLANAAAPATVVCLVISDVLGNPLEVIGSGPCLPAEVSPEAAKQILASRQIWDSIPTSVQERLASISQTPEHLNTRTPEHPITQLPNDPTTLSPAHIVIGDLWTALRAARDSAVLHGLKPMILTGWMQGEAREMGKLFGGIARDLPQTACESGINCIIAGGETTVTVRGNGKGGRSQELACAASAILNGVEGVALLAAGTDGTDGPTEAAGGLVDGETFKKAAANGLSVEESLGDSNTYAYLQAANSLVITGPTHTNVGDLVIAVYK